MGGFGVVDKKPNVKAAYPVANVEGSSFEQAHFWPQNGRVQYRGNL